MVLTEKQQQGLNIAVARYKKHEPWTCISGYAGSGKSTLVRFIVDALHLNAKEEVAYITFTGKAASVLRHKGCPNAMTAHKLLYYSKRLPSGKFIFTPRTTLDKDYKLIVVDEISMLPNDLWLLLLTHHVYVLACGDPFQIPPINKKQDNHVLDTPHIFLDEIMRQAAESDIIKLSMKVRNSEYINYNKGNDAMVLDEDKVVDGMYDWADQIICATNRKRLEINNYMRQKAGRGPHAEEGDKVIALNNCWDITDTKQENALVNGTIGYLQNIREDVMEYPIFNFPKVPVLIADLYTDDEIFENLIIDKTALETGKKFLTNEQEYQLYKNPMLRDITPIEFNFGYAITGHKAQGSQWGKVLVFEERFPFAKEEHARWVYTSITRAEDKVVLIR